MHEFYWDVFVLLLWMKIEINELIYTIYRQCSAHMSRTVLYEVENVLLFFFSLFLFCLAYRIFITQLSYLEPKQKQKKTKKKTHVQILIVYLRSTFFENYVFRTILMWSKQVLSKYFFHIKISFSIANKKHTFTFLFFISKAIKKIFEPNIYFLPLC